MLHLSPDPRPPSVTYGYGLLLLGGENATFAAMAAVVTASGAASGATRGGLSAERLGRSVAHLGNCPGGGFMVRTAIAAAAGGTAAEIGGGSFENGAISAAYTYMFNHAAEQGADIEIIKSAKTEAGYGLIDGIQDGLSVLGLVPFAGDVVDGINALIYLARGQHAEAAMSAAAMVPFGGIVSTGLRLSKRVGKLFKAKFSRTPKSLMDQMVLDAAKQGKGVKIIDSLGDPKFKGMEKWSYTKKSAAGLRSEVHYVRDPKTGQLMDFKFTHHAEAYK